MAYPRIVIDLEKIRVNVNYLLDISKKSGIDLMGITKVFSGSVEVAKLYKECGVKYLGDSRIENLKLYRDIDIPKVLIRLPMKSQVEEVVKYCDISMNSEIEVVEALDKEAKKQSKIHKIILMIELGDLREGILPKDVEVYMERIINLTNIKLEGIAVNLTCYGGVIPSPTNLGELEKIANFIEKKYNLKLNIISGGNSSSVELLLENKLPKKINNLRLGESLAFGREAAYGNHIDGCHGDAITLEAEIIELKEKDSVPKGEIGMNAFGEKPVFKDVGKMVRGIIAIGRQDVDQGNIVPKDDRLEIIGASSDHLIMDLTNAKDEYKVGDIISFSTEYGGLLQLSTSKYIKKTYK